MTRSEILNAALRCVSGDRDEKYGNPEYSFKAIADLWNVYLEHCGILRAALNAKDVATMMILFKVARISTGQAHEDNWVDICGYSACGGSMEVNHED